jgi:signal transduction histidine kinase
MAFFTPDGELLAATDNSGLWTNPPDELNDVLSHARALAGSEAKFSNTLSHPENGDLFMFVAAAATVDSPIAVGAFSPVSLARRTLANAFALGAQSAAFIVAQNEQVIYQIGSLSPSESSKTHPGVSEALRGESGTTYVDVDGSEHVVAYSPIRATGWALVIEEPWESVANPLLNTTQFAPLVLVPVVLLSMVALWFGARQIIQPLQALESLSSELAWGDYQSIEVSVGGIDEISRLQRTLIHLAQKIKRYQEGLRGYIDAITTGQEDERQRLARELHDGTIQALIALDQRVQLVQLQSNNNPMLDVSLEEIHTMTEQTIDDIRRFVRALRPLYLEELGLVAALEMLARETSGSAKCQIDFQQLGIERRVPPKAELALYRIAQEGLTNIMHHAEAKRASIRPN